MRAPLSGRHGAYWAFCIIGGIQSALGLNRKGAHQGRAYAHAGSVTSRGGGAARAAGPWTPSVAIFSGGSACNSFCIELSEWNDDIAYILPVSDNGGSSSAILDAIGGPAIGDIRSRLLRLAASGTEEERHVQRLLGHRLDAADAAAAEEEWHGILGGTHELWASSSISEPYQQALQAFLRHFDEELTLRHLASPARERFDYRGGSIGNFFFTGARLFFGSLPTAIYIWHKIARLPEKTAVIPVLNASETVTLGAELASGERILGQHEISHPNESRDNRAVDKGGAQAPLPSPIRRVFYVDSASGREVSPPVFGDVLRKVGAADGIVYSMGSLYTSVVPSLILEGVGDAIRGRRCRKLLLLNGAEDRETGGMRASDYVMAVRDACCTHAAEDGAAPPPCSDFVTDLLAPAGGAVELDTARLAELGVRVHVVDSEAGDPRAYEARSLVGKIRELLAA